MNLRNRVQISYSILALLAFNVPLFQNSQAQCPDSTVFVLSTDLEIDNGGLQADSLGDWEYGDIPTILNDSICSGDFSSPPGAHSGTKGWGTFLEHCYRNSGTQSVLSLNADLTDPNFTSAELSFYQWHEVFVSFDYLQVRVNGSVVFQNDTLMLSPDWYQTTIDLSPYLGEAANVEFVLFATNVVNRAGWYIDDLIITACYEDPNGLIESAGQNINLYPNPADEKLNIQFEGPKMLDNIEVIDAQGRSVKGLQIQQRTDLVHLNVAGLRTGVYLLRVFSDEAVHVARFFKR